MVAGVENGLGGEVLCASFDPSFDLRRVLIDVKCNFFLSFVGQLVSARVDEALDECGVVHLLVVVSVDHDDFEIERGKLENAGLVLVVGRKGELRAIESEGSRSAGDFSAVHEVSLRVVFIAS